MSRKKWSLLNDSSSATDSSRLERRSPSTRQNCKGCDYGVFLEQALQDRLVCTEQDSLLYQLIHIDFRRTLKVLQKLKVTNAQQRRGDMTIYKQ